MLNKLFNKQTFHLIIFLIIFTLGLKYVICKCNKEGYENLTIRCPNILIQKGSKFYLYNSKLTKVPGVNPLMFNNLEEYAQFIKWQRSQGIRCPVLYIQEVYNTQGKPVYKARNSPFNLQGGLPDIHIDHNNEVITTDVTWFAADNPHNVSGTLIILGGNLTLEPGVIIKFNKYVKMRFY